MMAGKRPPGWWYPWLFVAGMLVVIAVNAVMISYAIGTFPGLSTDDAYRKGLDYNRTLAAAEAQATRGWQVDLQVESAERPAVGASLGAAAPLPSAPRPVEIVARFVDAGGTPLSGLLVGARLQRPVGSEPGMILDLAEAGNGVYRTRADLPAAGQWDLRLLARRSDQRYQDVRRVHVR